VKQYLLRECEYTSSILLPLPVLFFHSIRIFSLIYLFSDTHCHNFFPITGDQGFLNSYYEDFPTAHVFQPHLPQEVLKTRPLPDMEPLSTLYNADVGLHTLANKVLLVHKIRWLLFMLTGKIYCFHNCWCYFFYASVVMTGTEYHIFNLSSLVNFCKSNKFNAQVQIKSAWSSWLWMGF